MLSDVIVNILPFIQCFHTVLSKAAVKFIQRLHAVQQLLWIDALEKGQSRGRRHRHRHLGMTLSRVLGYVFCIGRCGEGQVGGVAAAAGAGRSRGVGRGTREESRSR